MYFCYWIVLLSATVHASLFSQTSNDNKLIIAQHNDRIAKVKYPELSRKFTITRGVDKYSHLWFANDGPGYDSFRGLLAQPDLFISWTFRWFYLIPQYNRMGFKLMRPRRLRFSWRAAALQVIYSGTHKYEGIFENVQTTSITRTTTTITRILIYPNTEMQCKWTVNGEFECYSGSIMGSTGELCKFVPVENRFGAYQLVMADKGEHISMLQRIIFTTAFVFNPQTARLSTF